MIRLATYISAVAIGYAIVGHLDYETKHAEDKERVAQLCKRLGRTVAEDTSGRFTCMDLVPAWAMTMPLRRADHNQSVSQKNKSNLGKFEISTKQFVAIFFQAFIGLALAIYGLFGLFSRNNSLVFPVVFWVGILIAVSGPSIVLFLAT